MSNFADKTFVGGSNGDDDIRAVNDPDGSYLFARGGDDILRGGKFDDLLVGGEGNDSMFGGDGADQFRFFLNEVSGTDTDWIYDLDFSEGDELVFGNFAADTFVAGAGVNAFSMGTAGIINSIEGLQALVNAADDNWTAAQRGDTDTLELTYTDGNVTQVINFSSAWSDFIA
jgi:hypothetical protein